MISGAHLVLYTRDAEVDCAFFRDALRFPSVDAGHGWLIFALPPAEVAFHTADRNGPHELYLMCDDLKTEVEMLAQKRVTCSPVESERWGSITRIALPGGGKVGLHQPNHPTALNTR